jgi:serine/threonine protein phosphatase 1
LSKYVQRFERNTVGRDFAVGDVHGCFTALHCALDATGFDPAVDRLFSVGDLVDRGPESHLVCEWLDKPWFHPVQGNHEDMAIRYVDPGQRDRDHYMMNGGAWLIGATRDEQIGFALWMSLMPYAIEVETEQGIVGIVHADVAGRTWTEMVEKFEKAESKNQLKRVTEMTLWCRDRISLEDHSGIPDVRAVIVGHTPLKRPAVLGNVYHIDTGGWLRDGYFTLLNLATLETIPPTPKKLDWSGDE